MDPFLILCSSMNLSSAWTESWLYHWSNGKQKSFTELLSYPRFTIELLYIRTIWASFFPKIYTTGKFIRFLLDDNLSLQTAVSMDKQLLSSGISMVLDTSWPLTSTVWVSWYQGPINWNELSNRRAARPDRKACTWVWKFAYKKITVDTVNNASQPNTAGKE